MPRMIDPFYSMLLLAASAAVTAALIWVLQPWLTRYAMARPNARSSHAVPTPQGGGIAIVMAVAFVIIACALQQAPGFDEVWVATLVLGLAALAVAGAIDDIRPLPVLPRLLLQVAVALMLVHTLPTNGRLLTLLPEPVENVLLSIALVWFINLTNFMDGIDWMTVVEVVPIAACLVALGFTGAVPALLEMAPITLALLGAMIGFAPFNRHVARLFLGDVGSLPIGALVGWLLILLGLAGHPVAALILPLYYLSDSTITLARRALNGENIADAHRSHFYQRAVTGGLSVPEVTWTVFGLNVLLAMLAAVSVISTKPLAGAYCLAAAVLATLAVLWRFEKGSPA